MTTTIFRGKLQIAYNVCKLVHGFNLRVRQFKQFKRTNNSLSITQEIVV